MLSLGGLQVEEKSRFDLEIQAALSEIIHSNNLVREEFETAEELQRQMDRYLRNKLSANDDVWFHDNVWEPNMVTLTDIIDRHGKY